MKKRYILISLLISSVLFCPLFGFAASEDDNTYEAEYLILVNKTHHLDKNYKPSDLKAIKYYSSGSNQSVRYMRAKAADKFHLMIEAAKEKGYVIRMTSAFRSYEYQRGLWNYYSSKDGAKVANTYSAKPGQSEHQTGLAVDVSSPSVSYGLKRKFGDTKEGQWLANNAHNYGFILRYKKGKESETGYIYEPWHFRYVGKKAATEIYNRNITLETFLKDKHFINPTDAKVMINGEEILFDAYNINNHNYFKLRDIAFSLNGTKRQFGVSWDESQKAISLLRDSEYIAVGNEMQKKGKGTKVATISNAKIILDENLINLKAYNIDDNNYFKLRDLGELLDFGVDWDEANRLIIIDTRENPYEPDDPDESESTDNIENPENPGNPDSIDGSDGTASRSTPDYMG